MRSNQDIESFIKEFEARTLDKTLWTHEAHLVVAIWYASTYGFETALQLVRENIRLYNEAVGGRNTDTEGYHESITRFWLLVASDFIKNHRSQSIAVVCEDFIASDKAHRNYPLRFYSKERLFSVEARKTWVAPDLKEVPTLV